MTLSEAADKELRERLMALRAEARRIERQREELDVRATALEHECEALELILGDHSRESEAPESAQHRTGKRPPIRVLAMERAKANQGVVRLRELLRETQAHGFKIDHGGLHTYLKSLHHDFEQSGPGEFRVRLEIKPFPPGRASDD